MTGFGRSSFQVEERTFDVEVRSVNHRYLDVRARLPRQLAGLEGEVRARLQARFDRGKIELSVTAPGGFSTPTRVDVDLEAARGYLAAAASLRSDGIVGDLDIGTLLALPGVARPVESEVPAAMLREVLFGAIGEGVEALDAMRVAEGAALESELLGRIDVVEACVERIEDRAGEVKQAVCERLHRRAEQLGREIGHVDDARLHQELVIAADRLDITEELARLRSHVEQFRCIIREGDSGKPVGRRLDFLLQEFGREANTVGAKASDAPNTHEIVDLKTEIERLREQVQNVE